VKQFVFSLALVCAAGIVAIAANAPTLLPTGRSIVAPSGPVARVGSFPQGLALTRDGTRLLVVESGYNPPMLRILDARTLAERGTVTLRGAFGVPLVDADGHGGWIAGANADALFHVDLEKAAVDRTIPLARGCWPAQLTRMRAGQLAATCDLNETVAIVDEASGAVTASVRVGRRPNAIVASPDGSRLFVAMWGEHAIAVVEVGSAKLIRRIGVGAHPEALALAPDGVHLFVANTDDDSISIVDLRELDWVPRLVSLHFDATGLFGNSLNALAISPDGKRLYASAAAANAVYVLAIGSDGSLRRLGAIPAGWYPSAVLPTRAGVYVANAYGEGSHPNPALDLFTYQRTRIDFIGKLEVGSVRLLVTPDETALRAGDARVRQLAGNAPLRAHPVIRPHGPIRHVIYVIRENRTYDQVFGDVSEADGDPKIVLFGDQVTPNAHAVVRRFGVFDRTFTDAKVSPDGHNWSTAAIANDYVEKMWPQVYARPIRRELYDFEDPSSASRPHAGYLWDAAVNAGVSLRNYGEFIFALNDTPTFHAIPTRDLTDRTDFRYPGYDLSISDLAREGEWEREFRTFERNGKLPALEIVRLPNDHTEVTRPGALTPQAFVAQNDAAFGKIVDAVSHSRYWSSTAIFAIEDDCQSGPDHVDDQRTTFLIASPYAAGGVQHAMYTTASVLRTIEILLGIPPMTTYDARALPLYDAFRPQADLRPFEAIAPKIDITAKNATTAYRAGDSARLDFVEADRNDDGTMNDILWHAVKGVRATPPPYGAFRR
jgi:DNA-binding beta-propeller fold protein YncE